MGKTVKLSSVTHENDDVDKKTSTVLNLSMNFYPKKLGAAH
jgi:hypothetical protein